MPEETNNNTEQSTQAENVGLSAVLGGTTETKYVTTYDECLKQIRGVCGGCGGKLEPIETVDNSDHPTFWVGCMHCHKFRYGVDPVVFQVAKNMVLNENYRAYHHDEDPRHKKDATPEDIEYWLESQISGACDTANTVLRLYKKHSADVVSA